MNGHQKRRKIIEGRIIRAAMELFSENGFKRVSIEEVAEKAAVSKVTLYKYFTNKPTLIRQCLHLAFHETAEDVKARMDSEMSLQGKLESLMKAKLELMQRFSGEMLEELADFEPEFVDELMAIRRDAVKDLSMPILKEARAAGQLPSEISDEAFVVFLDIVGMGTLSSRYYKEYAGRNPNAFDEIQRITVSCLGFPT